MSDSEKVMVNAFLEKADANALSDLMRWRTADLSSCVSEAIHIYRKMLKARREGLLLQLFHPDGRIEDVDVKAKA